MRLTIKDSWGHVMGSSDVPAGAWKQCFWDGKPEPFVGNTMTLQVKLTCGRPGHLWLSVTNDKGRSICEWPLREQGEPGDTVCFSPGTLSVNDEFSLRDEEQAVAPHGFV